MTEAQSPRLGASARALGAAIVALTPLLAMLASARAFTALGASDGLLAAALELVPAAAPGYPVATWLAKLAALVPLGPLPLRIALSSSAALAIAAAALYRAFEITAAADGRVRPLVRSPLAVAVLVFAFSCDALFAVEPRPFAPSIALACLCIERLSAVRAAWPRPGRRPLRGTVFWFGLLAIEQPALALVVLAGSFPMLRRIVRAYHVPAMLLVALAASVPPALALFARAPERATAVRGLLTAFATSVGRAAFAERLAPIGLAASALLLGALIALARLVRQPAAYRAYGLWVGVTAAALAASLVLAQPDAAFALALCTAAATCALLLGDLLGGGERTRLASLVALCALLLGGSHLRAAALRASARSASTSDVLREALLRAVPARSLLLALPDSAAALHAAALEERVRPDVQLLGKPWRLDLAASEALVAALPELQPLLRANLLQGELPATELQTLAARRPLLIELDPARERTLYPALLPWGLYHQVSTSAVSRSDERFAAHEAQTRILALSALLEVDPSARADARDMLAARARADADYYTHVGDAERATEAHARERDLATGPDR